MSRENDSTPIQRNEPFVARWSRRKQAARHGEPKPDPIGQEEEAANTAAEQRLEEAPSDDDMPPIESLDAGSDFTPFFSPRVSESLRRLALRKLFHLPEFHVRDGLNDYDEDYTEFEPLGQMITQEMRRVLRRELDAEQERASAAEADPVVVEGDSVASPASPGSPPSQIDEDGDAEETV